MSIIERSVQRMKNSNEPVNGNVERVLLSGGPPQPAVRGAPLAIDFEAAERAGFDIGASRSGHLHTQMRGLKRKILDAVVSRTNAQESPIVLVTSAVPGDGKSFIAMHLAVSYSTQLDLDVTLIDADIARHQISSLFKADDVSGLSECLLNRTPIAASVRPTEVASLSILVAGETSESAAEALASSRWDELAAQMHREGRGRLFIVDTAPVLATPEAQYLAKCADLVLFVVRAEVTPTDAVAEALGRLSNVSNVAFVFNGRSTVGKQYLYSYGEYGARK